jgi:citrate lyase subunit beta/citryl-CoA lyase
VFIHLDDNAGFAKECRQGADLGFEGKTLIHPKTVEPANEAFSPSRAAVERARSIVAAHEAAKAAGAGVTVLDGRLVEELHAAVTTVGGEPDIDLFAQQRRLATCAEARGG